MCQTSLPAARPPDDLLVWERRQGRATLSVEAGKAINPHIGHLKQLGLPYGPKARLLLMHLNSEAVRRQLPVIPVEETTTAFFRRLMGRTQDGRQTKMLKAQLSALAAAQFRIGIVSGEGALQVDTRVVGAFNLWFEKNDNQRTLWPSTSKLSLDYFESSTRFAVPLDERAIAALAHSATALDIYCWLAQRLHRIPAGKPQFVPWTALHEQFGQGYNRVRKSRESFLGVLPQIQGVYPGARFETDGQGMRLWQSTPPVTKRLLGVQSGAERPEAVVRLRWLARDAEVVGLGPVAGGRRHSHRDPMAHAGTDHGGRTGPNPIGTESRSSRVTRDWLRAVHKETRRS